MKYSVSRLPKYTIATGYDHATAPTTADRVRLQPMDEAMNPIRTAFSRPSTTTGVRRPAGVMPRNRTEVATTKAHGVPP